MNFHLKNYFAILKSKRGKKLFVICHLTVRFEKKVFLDHMPITVISLVEAFSSFVITEQTAVGKLDTARWCVDTILCGRCKNKTAERVEKDSGGIAF